MRNSFWSFLTAMISRGGVLIFTIILARFLMPANYGIYSLVLATSMVFYTFADLGLSQTLARYISHSLVKDKKKIPSYYQYLLKTKFIFAAVVSILLLLLAYPLSIFVYKNEALFLPFLISALYIFILSLIYFTHRSSIL